MRVIFDRGAANDVSRAVAGLYAGDARLVRLTGVVTRRPFLVWCIPFVAMSGVLIARNAFLFSTRLYEQGDSGGNSILIQQALRFQLLVGHSSREKFNNPGPAYLYLAGWPRWSFSLFTDGHGQCGVQSSRFSSWSVSGPCIRMC
jgi:hypothetical protein